MEAPRGWEAVKKMYGDHQVIDMAHGTCRGDPMWERAHLMVLRNVCWTNLNIQLHQDIASLFISCLRDAMAACPDYKVRMLGGYCPRHQRNNPAHPLSIHSYGAAFDINWDTNPMGSSLVTDLPPKFVEVFTSNGWEWGGSWRSIKDAMHFQFAKNV